MAGPGGAERSRRHPALSASAVEAVGETAEGTAGASVPWSLGEVAVLGAGADDLAGERFVHGECHGRAFLPWATA